VVREGEEIPALVEKGPEIGPVAPANVLENGAVHFKGNGAGIQKEGEILVEQEAGQIGVLGLEGEFVAGLPALKEREPGGPNCNMNILVQFILFVLFIGFTGALAQESLTDFSNVSKLIERFGDGDLVKCIKGLLLGHCDISYKAMLQKLLHNTPLHYITDKEKRCVILEGSFGLEIVQEFLETPLLSL